MPGCASAGVERERTGRGFTGEIPGDGVYGVDGTCAAHTGIGRWPDAADTGLYQGVWEWRGGDGVLGWDRDWIQCRIELNKEGLMELCLHEFIDSIIIKFIEKWNLRIEL